MLKKYLVLITKTLSKHIHGIVKAKMLFPWRNDFMLSNRKKKTIENIVNLNYWDEVDNLGDALSPIIVNWMLSLQEILPEKYIRETKHLYAVGSILAAGMQDATVWGSGILRCDMLYRLEKRTLDIRAVRGPLTRAALLDYGYDVPEVYGDPAILMPEIYIPMQVEKKAKYGVVIHHASDLQEYKEYFNQDTVFIDICTTDYKSFLTKINSVDIVISQSLHGIILAEAYGIKAILLKPKVDLFKYYDYYCGTGRMNFPMAETIDEAKKLIPLDPPDFSLDREKLKKAFPYDIYEN